MTVKHSARAVSDVQAHLVLVSKYRKKVFTDEMLTTIEAVINKNLEKNGCELIEFNGEPDHVHLLFQYLPQLQLSKLVNSIKTATSRVLSKQFETQLKEIYWGKKVVWSSSYYVSSCGGVTVERLKEYIEEQERPN
ncbi:IS200/IS605 family transposase [Limnoraphis robusta Tam1]|uniref:IS200/IS605 family transposase n=1 Tax=Limnoraphis robusta CCNP1315 TaxID=3110306 RepID=A0ABU5TY94_9CYAN|nr:IS200/IS605 family transposase [Limnoraphis robusta]MEA5500208.1 IS200/IS605 family transposase [Limnoraphis robusta BA-68 BA1]MEA5519896.1 IS200/IS605 family transposase [Limnoraphis robusta CCNP1315]MEA5539678.1 IS200/IS605 family transposase [Limnoraphis robusta Tam1]MEA5547803.1 IS200/IS605 family transposase [Limnoraphis robusta CCNP1324]